MVGQHWRGFVFVAGVSVFFYGLKTWAEDYNKRIYHRKQPGQYDDYTPPSADEDGVGGMDDVVEDKSV